MELKYGPNTLGKCWPQWLCRMRVRLVIKRLRVQLPQVRQHSSMENDHEIFTIVILSLQLI